MSPLTLAWMAISTSRLRSRRNFKAAGGATAWRSERPTTCPPRTEDLAGCPLICRQAEPGREQRYDCTMVYCSSSGASSQIGVKLEEEKSTNVNVNLFLRNVLRANFEGIKGF